MSTLGMSFYMSQGMSTLYVISIEGLGIGMSFEYRGYVYFTFEYHRVCLL